MERRTFLTASLGSLAATQAAAKDAANGRPPEPQREFRAVWVATVANIDWPSKLGLSVEQQQAEMRAILDRVKALNMNAVVFQVRPACDALYDSKLEPWSEFLTGTMGRAPDPYYDPLKLWVEEAHQRGLELHAWFNPYRAHHFVSKSPISANHISKTHPEMVRQYGRYLWLDPGEPSVLDYSVGVVQDVVKRYDIDGIHIDDYFYPYKEQDAQKNNLPFPDDASWAKYRAGGGKLSRDDWRRNNVDRFVEQMYRVSKKEKPWVKVGISPFGIWRPGYPPQIQGFDAYDQLYADSRKWLREGWVDYWTPQLYWSIEQTKQSYPVLLKWWQEQNTKKRHMWAGNIIDPVSSGKWPVQEILNQVKITREAGAGGNVYFSMKVLMGGDKGLGDALRSGPYAEPALVPATPWIDKIPPAKPKLLTGKGAKELKWESGGGEPVWLWVLQVRRNGKWTTSVLPAGLAAASKGAYEPAAGVQEVAISAVDRTGNQGPAATVKLGV